MLNIDTKQYYKQIVEKHIPMHLWYDWITERLYQVTGQKKGAVGKR